jgi:hypothetical protein
VQIPGASRFVLERTAPLSRSADHAFPRLASDDLQWGRERQAPSLQQVMEIATGIIWPVLCVVTVLLARVGFSGLIIEFIRTGANNDTASAGLAE